MYQSAAASSLTGGPQLKVGVTADEWTCELPYVFGVYVQLAGIAVAQKANSSNG